MRQMRERESEKQGMDGKSHSLITHSAFPLFFLCTSLPSPPLHSLLSSCHQYLMLLSLSRSLSHVHTADSNPSWFLGPPVPNLMLSFDHLLKPNTYLECQSLLFLSFISFSFHTFYIYITSIHPSLQQLPCLLSHLHHFIAHTLTTNTIQSSIQCLSFLSQHALALFLSRRSTCCYHLIIKSSPTSGSQYQQHLGFHHKWRTRPRTFDISWCYPN